MDRSSFEASRRARAKQRELEGHPTPGDLAAYHAGRLTDPRKRQVQDHLAVCEDCAVLYDSLIEFEQFQPEPDASGADPSDAAWLRMRERLREEEAAEAPVPEEEPRTAVQPLQRRRVPVWQRPVVAWAVAAGLMMCVVGLGLRVGSLQEEVRESSRLRLVSDAEPLEENQERGEEAPEVASISGEGILVLSPPVDPPFDEYEVELAPASGGSPLASLRGPAPRGYLNVLLPPGSLPTGEYLANIYGIEGNQRQSLKKYRFEVGGAGAAP